MVPGPASGAGGRLKRIRSDDEIAVLPISIADSDGLF